MEDSPVIIFLAVCAAVLLLLGLGIWIYGDILSRGGEKHPKYEDHSTV